MGGLVDVNLPAEHTQLGRQVHRIRHPDLQRLSPNSPANGLWRRSSLHGAPHPEFAKLGLGARDGTHDSLTYKTIKAPYTALSHHNSSMAVSTTDLNDTPLQPQLIIDHPLEDSQNRKRAPSKHLSRCSVNLTSFASDMSEPSEEEVDYGVEDIVGNSNNTGTDYEWSTQEDDSVD